MIKYNNSMFNWIILVIGDLAVTALEGFYMGVGIRESAAVIHILGMTIPTFGIWLLFSWLLKIYDWKCNPVSADEPKGSQRSFRDLIPLLKNVIRAQKPFRLAAVWFGTSLFAVFWQTWYWYWILKLDRGISLRFTFFFCLVGINFLFFWRMIWSAFVMLRILAKEHLLFRIFCWVSVTFVVLYQIPAVVLTIRYDPQKYTLAEIKTLPYDTALVFGAGVYQNGTASSVLRDRVNTAVELYHSGLVKSIIMSGDNSDQSRNEVDVMTDLAINQDVPEQAVLKDPAGMDTALTCFHALDQFGKDSAVLVTQGFHTTRALYTCDHYGVKAVSVAADQSVYNIFSWLTWHLRDWIGLTLVWINYELLP